MTPDSGRRKVCGGTWYHRVYNVRAAHRDDLSTARWDTDIGFRTFRRFRESATKS